METALLNLKMYSKIFSLMSVLFQTSSKGMGIDVTTLSWEYDKDFVAEIISKEFEPLLKKIAQYFMHMLATSYYCQVGLLRCQQ